MRNYKDGRQRCPKCNRLHVLMLACPLSRSRTQSDCERIRVVRCMPGEGDMLMWRTLKLSLCRQTMPGMRKRLLIRFATGMLLGYPLAPTKKPRESPHGAESIPRP